MYNIAINDSFIIIKRKIYRKINISSNLNKNTIINIIFK